MHRDFPRIWIRALSHVLTEVARTTTTTTSNTTKEIFCVINMYKVGR